MKRFIIVVVILAVIGAGVYWFLNKGDNNVAQNRETKSTVSNEKSKPSTNSDVGTGEGSFSEYHDITKDTGEGYSSAQTQTSVGTGN